MNNLLRTLTESQVKPAGDLRLLLTTVKEGRKSQDIKLTDPFYDSLEGLLTDLKTITIDNRDAEAFLKPVSRAEVPDYYDVIQHPMDFQTMLKKVKQKQYKSKREFKDDLDLIWSNCLTYNAAENHPLRPCVYRLREKAEKLLKHITDRKERADPPIPSDLPSTTAGGIRRINGTTTSLPSSSSSSTTNGYLNGRSSHTHSRSSSLSQSQTQSQVQSKTGTPKSGAVLAGASVAGKPRKDVPFAESPAIVRTPEGMALFREWDAEVGEMMDVDVGVAMDVDVVKPEEKEKNPVVEKKEQLVRSLRELVPVVEFEVDEPEQKEIKREDAMVVDGAVAAGEKRKLNGATDRRPRKKAKFATQYPTPLLDERDDLTQLWWGAVQSDALLGNGLPGIPFGPSSSKPLKRKVKKDPSASTSATATASTSTLPLSLPPLPSTPVKRRIKKSSSSKPQDLPPPPPQNPKSLLVMMNNNIKTMRRLRHTHTKFAALSGTTAPGDGDEEGAGAGPAGEQGAGAAFGSGSGSAGAAGGGGPSGVSASPMKHAVSFADDVEEEVNDKIDESPWTVARRAVGGGKGKGKAKNLSGIELGPESAQDCLHWTTNKVLEHVGFQGTSAVALDVLADVASEYLQNVGRTIKYLSDQFGKTMTPEEIILHTLFESGSSKIQDLERYISDDIERYGARLTELDKKLVSAYTDLTAGEVLDDEALFEEDPEEVGTLAMGDFADMLGEDYLGLRELGIAEEFGLSNLSIPKKLLRGKKAANRPAAAKPTEPPPPYPPPPPFVPLTADKVDDQIGLLKGYYQSRFTQLAVEKAPAPPQPTPGFPPLPGAMQPFGLPGMPQSQAHIPGFPPSYPPNTLPSMALHPASLAPPQPKPEGSATPVPQPDMGVLSIPPDLSLPDELPDSTHMKIGPLGQVLMSKAGGGAGVGKKKKDTAAAAASGGGGPAAASSNPGGSGGHGGGGGGGLPPGLVLANASAAAGVSPPGKKKKGNLGVGTGNGRKKKDGPSGPPPGPGMSGYGQGGLPAVVFASA